MAACSNNILGNRGPNALEDIARAEMESVYGRVLSDTEWQRTGTSLRAFAELLRGWELVRRNAHSEIIPIRKPEQR
jgi:hypothetical protein